MLHHVACNFLCVPRCQCQFVLKSILISLLENSYTSLIRRDVDLILNLNLNGLLVIR